MYKQEYIKHSKPRLSKRMQMYMMLFISIF